MARGHRLNASIVLVSVHDLSGLFQAVSAVEPFTLSPPSHSVPIPNRPTRLCGCKATLNQNTHTKTHKKHTLGLCDSCHWWMFQQPRGSLDPRQPCLWCRGCGDSQMLMLAVAARCHSLACRDHSLTWDLG